MAKKIYLLSCLMMMKRQQVYGYYLNANVHLDMPTRAYIDDIWNYLEATNILFYCSYTSNIFFINHLLQWFLYNFLRFITDYIYIIPFSSKIALVTKNDIFHIDTLGHNSFWEHIIRSYVACVKNKLYSKPERIIVLVTLEEATPFMI